MNLLAAGASQQEGGADLPLIGGGSQMLAAVGGRAHLQGQEPAQVSESAPPRGEMSL